ncbi:hypothetical protein COM13_24800 [Bacillus pseudomycoides]|nr:hypothetical protein COO07_18595 [Bacillus pseudomycoides]PEE03295.1 hypothetical protein CON86_26475 [Bacillus pseudomycoides]PEK79583.1 hypothetical protein CN597_12760 [Bacillus pseudomycoides]PEM66158.1 hypothetical protein CN632_27580 [Bacillus pseudomycoides]PEN04639.1 hypothetical protein CN640_22570 [Bacillus pseudomycoides]
MFDEEVACWGGLFFIWGWGAEFVGWSIYLKGRLILYYLYEYKFKSKNLFRGKSRVVYDTK